VVISTDLGLTIVEVKLDAQGVSLPGGQKLAWESAEAMAATQNVCLRAENGTATKIQSFQSHWAAL
jgi:hypothetical protein